MSPIACISHTHRQRFRAMRIGLAQLHIDGQIAGARKDFLALEIDRQRIHKQVVDKRHVRIHVAFGGAMEFGHLDGGHRMLVLGIELHRKRFQWHQRCGQRVWHEPKKYEMSISTQTLC